MRRFWIMLLAVALALVIALPAGADKPDCDSDPLPGFCKDDPAPEPEIWTCQARVDNGAVWVLGAWDNTLQAYVSDPGGQVDVDIPLCIDIDDIDIDGTHSHRDVTEWTVTWTGDTARKDPKGLMLIFEEGVHDTVYAQTEVTPTDGQVITPSPEPPVTMDLDFNAGDGKTTHLVFVAMPRSGDKWTNISFTVTPVLTSVPPIP